MIFVRGNLVLLLNVCQCFVLCLAIVCGGFPPDVPRAPLKIPRDLPRTNPKNGPKKYEQNAFEIFN